VNGTCFQMFLRRQLAALGSHDLPLSFPVHIDIGPDVVSSCLCLQYREDRFQFISPLIGSYPPVTIANPRPPQVSVESRTWSNWLNDLNIRRRNHEAVFRR